MTHRADGKQRPPRGGLGPVKGGQTPTAKVPPPQEERGLTPTPKTPPPTQKK